MLHSSPGVQIRSAKQVRTMQLLIGGVLLVGITMLVVVATVVGNGAATPQPQPAPPAGGATMTSMNDTLFMVGGGMAVVMLPLSFVMRKLGPSPDGVDEAAVLQVGFTKFLIGASMCEAPALFGGVLILVTQQVFPPVLIAGVGAAGVLAHTLMPVVRDERNPYETSFDTSRR